MTKILTDFTAASLRVHILKFNRFFLWQILGMAFLE